MRRRTNTRIISRTEDRMIAQLDRTRATQVVRETITDPMVTVRVSTQAPTARQRQGVEGR